jgi:hypothetical protein
VSLPGFLGALFSGGFVETIYKKKEKAHEVLIEYYAYYDLRRVLKELWLEEDAIYEKRCNELYEKFETLKKAEMEREENSKSARIAQKLEQMKLSQELIVKIKRRNERS